MILINTSGRFVQSSGTDVPTSSNSLKELPEIEESVLRSIVDEEQHTIETESDLGSI